LQLADRQVPRQASVPVVGCPLDDDIFEMKTPADLQRQLGEVALEVGDEPVRSNRLGDEHAQREDAVPRPAPRDRARR